MARQLRDRLAIAIAGAGRAGGALASAFAAAGIDVRVWDRRPAKAGRIARIVGCASTSRLDRLVRERDIVVVCVTDDAIAALARDLAAGWPSGAAPGVVLHTAGSLPAGILGSFPDGDASIGVFHPVVALDGPRSAGRLAGAAATVSGQPTAVRAARDLALRIGMTPVTVRDEARPLLHLAAVMAAGDMVGLLGAASRVLADAGVDGVPGHRLLVALARTALEACEEDGPARALTGPVARGDAAALTRHFEALGASGLSAAARRETADLHAAAARAGVRLLEESGRLDAAALRRLRRALSRPRR